MPLLLPLVQGKKGVGTDLAHQRCCCCCCCGGTRHRPSPPARCYCRRWPGRLAETQATTRLSSRGVGGLPGTGPAHQRAAAAAAAVWARGCRTRPRDPAQQRAAAAAAAAWAGRAAGPDTGPAYQRARRCTASTTTFSVRHPHSDSATMKGVVRRSAASSESCRGERHSRHSTAGAFVKVWQTGAGGEQ